MIEKTEDPAADIAWMRRLAEDGAQAPLLNGPIMIAAGVIFGAANVIQWAIQTGALAVDPMAQLWLWLAAGAVFALALFILIRRASRKPGFGSHGNKAVGAAWSAIGFGIFVMWLSLMAIGFRSGDWTMMWAMPSIVATAYGSAWMVSAAATGQRWMTLVGLLAYAGAIVSGALIGSTTIYLVFAVLMVATALVPGFVLMRQEPAEVA
ncbi:MAG: hypothetical protein PSV23_09655 [Brevundimonas sp.]|uniref:hypothetical protein n=1 Tax=Brevundimonas sp. TaxID=1871086 RepID=UPI00248917D3|nr:hypothetical protein [Brevundimonas sp.]MDI1327047.1 hypothetical protein [Brevundimonas sp.]